MKYSKYLSSGALIFVLFLCFSHLFPLQNATADVPDMMINSDGTTEIHNMSQIWVSPTDSNVVMTLWRDFRLGYRRVAHGVSYNEGQTWSDTLITRVDNYWYTDPIIKGDQYGNFYLMTMTITSDKVYEDFNLWKSTDNGASWSEPIYLFGETTGYQEDKECLAIDRTGGIYDGNMYVGWTRFPLPTSIMSMRSTNGGVSWEDPIVVGSPDLSEWGAGHFAFPLVDAYGNIYVVFQSWLETGEDYQECQRIVKSTDGGQTFTEPEVILETEYINEAPGPIHVYNAVCMDADITNGPYRGNIYLTVPNGIEEGSYFHSDILFMKSSDGGDNWTSPLRINDDPMGQPVWQFHPFITVNQQGVIIILFYDQRNDPPEYNNFDTYTAFSFDGGETFTSNYRVSDVSSDPDYGKLEDQETGESNPIYLCNYIGMAAYYDQVHCTWTDTRDGNQNIYYSNFKIPLLFPRLYYPENESYTSDTQPGFWWAACGFFDEVHYDLEISTDSQFVSIDFTYPDIDTNFLSLTSSLDETTYFWRVKAFNGSDTSEYSTISSFTVDTIAPDMPDLIFPVDSSVVTDSLPEFTWSEIAFLKKQTIGAPVFYTLQICTDSIFTPGPELYQYTDIYTISLVIPDFLPDFKTYFWRVKAEDEAGNQSNWQDHPFQFEREVNICGDVNYDWNIDLSDVIYLANYYLKSGDPPPDPICRANANGDELINLSDVIYIANFYLKGGPAPHDCGNY